MAQCQLASVINSFLALLCCNLFAVSYFVFEFQALCNIVFVAFVTILKLFDAFVCTPWCWLLRNCYRLKNETTGQLEIFSETKEDPN